MRKETTKYSTNAQIDIVSKYSENKTMKEQVDIVSNFTNQNPDVVKHYLNALNENPNLSVYQSYSRRTVEKTLQSLLTEQDVDNLTLIPLAKKILMCNSSELTYLQNCQALKFIVQYVLEITPEEFCSNYNIAFLKKHGIKNVCNRITENAPESVLVNNGFQTKETLLQCVWPEFYNQLYKDKNFSSIDSQDIFNCYGTLKGSLCRAATPKIGTVKNGEIEENAPLNADGSFKSIFAGDPDTCHGKSVDILIYNAISDFLESHHWTVPQIFDYLANYKDYYRKAAQPVPGCFKVIDAREIYKNPLDFYMLNSSVEFQEEYMHDYVRARRQIEEFNPLIEAIYELYQEDMGER